MEANMKRIILLFITFCSAFVLYGEELEMLVGAERAALLLAGDFVSEIQFNNPTPLLVPAVAGVQDSIQSVQNSFRPNTMAESLYLYKKPADANQVAWTEDELTAIYNNSLALSSLAGIQYYSSSRKTMRTFYETSVVIDNLENKNPRRDPVYQIPPKDLTLYARQKDLTFGDNVYQYTYHKEDDYLVFIQENLSSMNIGIIPVVGKNRLRSVITIIDAGENLLVYVVSMAETIMFPGISERVGNSFSTRAEAILTWFTGQADKAFQSASRNR
jgi:hypothetical protein